jgi:hypothetical protein
MRYRRAIEKLRILAEVCEDFKRYPSEEPFLLEAYVFGALSRLRSVHASYWDYDWRRDNRGGGRYPEHELWEAVQGYLDLLDAQSGPPAREEAECGGGE